MLEITYVIKFNTKATAVFLVFLQFTTWQGPHVMVSDHSKLALISFIQTREYVG